ncbi:hypothetical protein J437_LFUL005635 [Ladona fulva]|uniref:Impact N-terminal domain-containing protein n=1 Tax=Ladona fulva TaxID=123851 RepID=A0A8K0NY41_LADFU|nr:hypothetical protein J437_LFUL005635 [Ladona fulva]
MMFLLGLSECLTGMDDNLTRQIEEVEALQSIYDDSWVVEDEAYRSYSIKIEEGSFEVTLENLGEPILFLWIDKLRSILQNKKEDVTAEENSELLPGESYSGEVELSREDEILETPPITHGETITDRKSVFQGHSATIVTVEQVNLCRSVLSKLYENKKIANATHNIYAYRIYKEDKKSFIQDCEDDGETHAGGRLLHLLQIVDARNVIVVVTRWYGGVHLGPDRFRHINNAARQILELSGHIKSLQSPSTSEKHSKKKK